MRTWLERVPDDRLQVTRALARWKELCRTGWQVTCLQERATGDLICLGFVEEPVQLELRDPVRGVPGR